MAANDTSFSYETALARLNQIVQELQEGSLSFEDSRNRYREGMQLLAQCRAFFDEAELEVRLIENQNGQLSEVDF